MKKSRGRGRQKWFFLHPTNPIGVVGDRKTKHCIAQNAKNCSQALLLCCISVHQNPVAPRVFGLVRLNSPLVTQVRCAGFDRPVKMNLPCFGTQSDCAVRRQHSLAISRRAFQINEPRQMHDDLPRGGRKLGVEPRNRNRPATMSADLH